jgi:hypothetical protein
MSSLMGDNTARRDLVAGTDPAEDALIGTDPNLKLDPPIDNPYLKAYRVPFTSVSGVISKETNDLNKLFDPSTTNEIDAARTASNGQGFATFETQTSLEAPHLGCGASSAPCWLVVVPRGDTNLDGTSHDANTNGRISGSPLSASAWKNRIVVKLGFQSVSQNCPIGNEEQRLVGADASAAAVTSWQPKLCGTGTTYGFSLIGDGEARRQIVSSTESASRLALVSSTLDDATRGTATIKYAPVAQSAIVVAYTADYNVYPGEASAGKNGLQVQDLTLNARLVAKLLTQSYSADVPGRGAAGSVVRSNAKSIVSDPEFLALNPQFVGMQSDVISEGAVVALGSTDANAEVWSWLRADPLASAFLQGEPDDYGMKINPAYLALDLAHDTSVDYFPKTDLSTFVSTDDPNEPGYGTLNLRPYADDSLNAAYHAFRADSGAKTVWNQFKLPAAYDAVGSEPTGSRFIFAITDAASAARYGLAEAKIVNGAGQATAPTAETIGKAIAAMPASSVDATVRVFDGNVRTAGAYPLPTVVYAAVNVCVSSKSEISDYKKFIRYAISNGQVSGDAPGQLPRGYVPLGADAVTQSNTVAAALPADRAKCATTASSTPTPKPTSSTGTTPVTPPVVPPVDAPPPVTQTSSSTSAPATVPDYSQNTPKTELAATRFGLAGSLAAGIPLMFIGPMLTARGRRLGRLGGGGK